MSSEANISISRQWTIQHLEGANSLHSMMLKGLVANKDRYTLLKTMTDKDFLDGVYLGLCDYFNEGFDIEDLSDKSRAMLGLPLLDQSVAA
jgi:hypothetical protein